jgi:hypothetical protein
MAFNITNLVNAINAKSVTVGADSALDKAVLLASNVKNASIYSSLDDLPTADSLNHGDLVRIGASFGADTNYYVSHRDRWNLMNLSDSGSIVVGQYRPFQGTNYGFTMGGANNIIDKFPFASDGDATDVGDLTAGTYLPAGQSSETHGYATESALSINKFSFTSNANATDVGNLSYTATTPGGGSSSATHGYTAGGWTITNNIDKFPFASDGDGTDVGDLTVGRARNAGQTDAVNAFGYNTGGASSTTASKDEIDKYSFSTDGNATDVGNLTIARMYMSGQSSTTHGYTTGGNVPGGYASDYRDRIDKFSFSSGGNATDVGNLLEAKFAGSAGQSSTASGYTSGGDPATYHIEKFPFASDGNSTDVGDLTANRNYAGGTQY